MRATLAQGAIVLLMVAVLPPAEAREVGKALFARGAITAQLDGRARIVGTGAAVFEGDVVSSGPRSFALIEYEDGTRMTVRPNSQLRVEEFDSDEGEESALLSLFKGGFRAITGLIARRNPGGFNVQTSVATIGIRGTDFSARLCDAACRAEAQRAGAGPVRRQPTAEVVGRVSFVNGELRALDAGGDSRRMLAGAAVYVGDRLRTSGGSFAVVAFLDQSRITLQEDSLLTVANLRYDPTGAVESGALLRLARGGVRVITGLIGTSRPDAFLIETPIATVSAEEARFSVFCLDQCTTNSADAGLPSAFALALLDLLAPAAQAQGGASGMVIAMQDGVLTATFLATGETATFGPGQIGQLQPGGGVQLLAALPAGLAPAGPDPADTPFDAGQFEKAPLPDNPEGALIVAVFDDGHAVVQLPDGRALNIGKDEAVFAGAGQVLNIAGGTPTFIARDTYNINPQTFNVDNPVNNLLSDPEEGDSAFQCEM